MSRLIVVSEIDLFAVNSGFVRSCELLGQGRVSAGSFVPSEIGFSTDRGLPNPLTFKFERRANVPFDQNRYFTSASVSTDTHLMLLQAFQEMLVPA